MAQSTQIVFSKTPQGAIIPGETFTTRLVPAPTADSLADGQVLVDTLYLSLDPVMRVWLVGISYLTVPIGSPMVGGALVRVAASRSAKFSPGDYGIAWSGWVSSAVVGEGDLEKVDVPEGGKLTDAMSITGFTGLTGYFGMTRMGKPKAGETVVVSAAAGATGGVAAQVAKIMGARVVGIAGSEDKCRLLKEEFGLDEAVNYKADDYEQRFEDAVKGGIDVYFDNVGGKTLQMVIDKVNKGARIVICGDVSSYNTSQPTGGSKAYAPTGQVGVTNIFTLALKAATMYGFNIFEYLPEVGPARAELAGWAGEGKLKRSETITRGGLEEAPGLLMDLFEGKNVGKMLLEVE